MEQEKKSGFRTLLLSVLFSASGPIVLGLGLLVGHSSTQIADFTRRTAELLALIVALVVYAVTNRRHDMDEERKQALERKGNLFTGAIMCVSGLSMLLLTVLPGNEDKGNVIPAMAIALMGVVANSIFWRRYTALARRQGNAILAVQARLYGAKTAVDVCVTAALAAVLAFPGTSLLAGQGRLPPCVAVYDLLRDQDDPGAGSAPRFKSYINLEKSRAQDYNVKNVKITYHGFLFLEE